ncbi:hypothetical protein J4Q44_G00043210 [Coregonus suidteri]|uniref:Ciliary neurotrophic factor n=1 Tax=Coregonus suidteri TaxID=861788 RepID=A0AAN8R672_9TELE
MATASHYYGVHIQTASVSGAAKRGVHGGIAKYKNVVSLKRLPKFIKAVTSTLCTSTLSSIPPPHPPLQRKKETFAEELTVGEERLVTVPPLSSQLSPNDRLWRIYSALQQCRNLLERAIGREERVGNGGDRAEYESQKKTVRDRLGHLLESIRLLLADGAGTATFTPDPKNTEIDGPVNGSPFALKLWIYRIFNELEQWTRIASQTL